MKIMILFLLSLSLAYGAPVLNKNLAAEGTFVTIWPDHVDPDHFYFAPNFMKIAVGSDNLPLFHFTQFFSSSCEGRFIRRRNLCHYKALITSLMIAGFDQKQLLQAQSGIVKLRPNARFSAIPFISSSVDFGNTLNEFIIQHDCSPRAGQAADQIPCSMVLNKRGVENLMPFLNEGKIVPFKFVYKVAGVIEVADGKYNDELLEFGLPVNMGGEILRKYPELDTGFLWEE